MFRLGSERISRVVRQIMVKLAIPDILMKLHVRNNLFLAAFQKFQLVLNRNLQTISSQYP